MPPLDPQAIASAFPPGNAEERQSVLQFIRKTPLVYGTWKHFKGLYKRAEATLVEGDAEILGAFIARLDNAPLAAPSNLPQGLPGIGNIGTIHGMAVHDNYAFILRAVTFDAFQYSAKDSFRLIVGGFLTLLEQSQNRHFSPRAVYLRRRILERDAATSLRLRLDRTAAPGARRRVQALQCRRRVSAPELCLRAQPGFLLARNASGLDRRGEPGAAESGGNLGNPARQRNRIRGQPCLRHDSARIRLQRAWAARCR